MSQASQKCVLITGCSAGGIGAALAREFHRRGLRVFATGRNLAKLAEFSDTGIETIKLDVCSDESIKTAVTEVSKLTGGKLDYLVNNSGGGYHKALLDAEIPEAKKMFDVNFWATLAVTQAFAPLLIKSKGVIVNNASIAAICASPFQGIYNASKSATLTMGDVLRVEMAPFDVQVVTLMTGTVKTKFYDSSLMEHMEVPENSLYKPIEDKVNAVADGSWLAKWMDADEYARRTVGDLLKVKPAAHIYRGYYASQLWFLMSFMPHWLTEQIQFFLTGVMELKKKRGSGKKST
ncbi:MAG: hypothetical protein Q9227_000323 [Pyrenula ochraceoflavens]